MQRDRYLAYRVAGVLPCGECGVRRPCITADWIDQSHVIALYPKTCEHREEEVRVLDIVAREAEAKAKATAVN